MLLQPMLARLARAKDLDETLRVGLHDLISLHGAEMGNIQLLTSSGVLVIVAAWGLKPEFLDRFERVSPDSGSVCARAVRSGKPVFVPDVNTDPQFAPFRDVAASVPFRSVLSCPLVTSCGASIGAVSAHSANQFRPSALELRSAESYARHLADAIAARLPEAERSAYAERHSRALLARAA